MSGASRAQNSIGESCANASFFGRTSSPFREKTCVQRRHPPQHNYAYRLDVCAPWIRPKIIKSSYPLKEFLYENYAKLLAGRLNDLRVQKGEKTFTIIFFDNFMKYFAIISLKAWKDRWQKVKLI